MAADARTAHSMEDSIGAPVSGLWEPLRAVLLAPWSLTDLHEAVPRPGAAPTPRELRPRIACGAAAPADRWHRERRTVKGYEADAVRLHLMGSRVGTDALADVPRDGPAAIGAVCILRLSLFPSCNFPRIMHNLGERNLREYPARASGKLTAYGYFSRQPEGRYWQDIHQHFPRSRACPQG